MQIGREICKSEILWQGRWIKVENEKHGSLDEMKREREKRKKREIGTYSVWRACCWSGLGAESQAAGMAASSNPRNLWFASRSRPPRSLLALSPRCTETWCLWQKKISIIRLLTDAKTLHFLLNETNIHEYFDATQWHMQRVYASDHSKLGGTTNIDFSTY